MKAGVAQVMQILRPKSPPEIKEDISNKRSIHQEDINVAPGNRSTKHRRPKLTKLKGEIRLFHNCRWKF